MHLGCRLSILGLALVCARLDADTFFVATDGTLSGSGTFADPFSLDAALSGQAGQPGDTFLLRGGDYKLGHMDISIEGLPGKPTTFQQWGGEQARIDGSVTIFNSNGYLLFRDLEIYSSDTNRLSAQPGPAFDPTDITNIPGVSCYVPNCSFINLVIRDQTRHGIYLFQGSTNSVVYGCVVYNNGWASPDNAEGHGLYVQGDVGTREISDNIVFNNSGANMHVYESVAGGRLTGIDLEGNVVFQAGGIQNVRSYRDVIIGVDSPAQYADRIIFTDNMGYSQPGFSAPPEIQIGRDGYNGSVIVKNNYLAFGLTMNNWRTATVTGNLFAPRQTNYVINLNQRLLPLLANWDDNTYVCSPTGNGAMLDSEPFSFSDWQTHTGYDSRSMFIAGEPRGSRVFVRPNRYEPGRASIVVYNWDNRDNVSVDVSSVLPAGRSYEVRNAQDLAAPPVLSGIFNGERLQLPMTNLTVAVPNGPMITPPPTGPTFNVFLLLPIQGLLQIQQSDGSIQLRWPASSRSHVLQCKSGLGGSAGWVDATNQPVFVGDHFMVTEKASPGVKFYRLRIE